MEEITFRRADSADVPALIELRAAFLAEVAGSGPAEPALLPALSRYFSAAVPSGEFIAFLAVAGGRIIAASGLVFHRYPPSARNLQGLEAYVMNMYTLPAWRGKGIASALLWKLMEVARASNCSRVRLHALPKAQPIYARAGFASAEGEMQFDLR
jgi:GNAT superfamily N-acetyltransferase